MMCEACPEMVNHNERKRYLVYVGFDGNQTETYIVYAASALGAQQKAIHQARMKIGARVVGERLGPKEEDHLIGRVVP